MYKNMRKFGVFAAILLATTAANAIVIVDTVDQNVNLQTGESYSFSHNLLDDGFDLGTATSGSIEILFSDNTDKAWEVILIQVEAFDFDTGGLLIASSAYSYYGDLQVNALSQINIDGMLDITIKSWWGDFTVGQSVLKIDGGIVALSGDIINSVPEPGVLAMLAIGLLGFGIAGQKRKT